MLKAYKKIKQNKQTNKQKKHYSNIVKALGMGNKDSTRAQKGNSSEEMEKHGPF